MEKKSKLGIQKSEEIHTNEVPSKNKTPHKAAVDKMTSREFQMDISAHIETSAQMLKDKVFIHHFQTAILHNKHLFCGRTVLDIGCGMGILSLFAAKAGAKCVYAVDCSNVCDYTERIVKANHYENVIKVIKGRIEDIELPTKQVDIIICNWLGYSLLFQSIASAVIFARDKWLKKPGIIFPDVAKLFMAAIEDNKYKNEHVEWWKDVYGFNMKCLREFVISEPCYQAVKPHQVISTYYPIKKLDLYTATCNDLKFRTKYMLKMQRSGHVDGLVTYFHVHFSKSHTPMGFSTDPTSPLTHWMQSVFFFDEPISAIAGSMYYGGIEMFSTNAQCDLNNMEMGLEMYSGDPMQLQLETEMRWFLKPHTLNPTNTSSQFDENHTAQAQQAVVRTTRNKNIAHTATEQIRRSKKLTIKRVPLISIGKQEYPCLIPKVHKNSKNLKKVQNVEI